MRGLITGATGQDGSYLAELLLEKGYEVYGLRRRSATDSNQNIEHLLGNPAYHLVYGDLATENHLVTLIGDLKPDEIYNLGGQSDVGVSFEIPEYTGDVTGLGVTRLLEAVRKTSPGSRVYQASSAEMLGGTRPPQTELTPFRARSPYAAAKIYAHEMCRVYREAYGLFVSCGVLSNHESPRRGMNFVTRKITRSAARIKLGLQSKLELGNLDAEKDWGYAPEYVKAMWLMLQQDTPDDFIVATGKAHTVRDFVDAAFHAVGLNWRDYVVVNPALVRPADTFKFEPDVSKAKRVLGWEPRVSFGGLVAIMVDTDLQREAGTVKVNTQV